MIARLNSRVTHTPCAAAFSVATLFLVAILALTRSATAQGTVDIPQPMRAAVSSPAGSATGVAEQLANSFDAGDFYITPKGKRPLHRLAGAVAVRLDGNADGKAVLGALTRPGGSLAGYKLDGQYDRGIVVLKAAEAERATQLRKPSVLGETVAVARVVPGIESADPVFIAPECGLWMIALPEVVVRLKPGTDPKTYFGAEWTNAKAFGGPADQFLVKARSRAAEGILAEAINHAANPAVKWAEPNFLCQVISHLTPNDTYYAQQWHLNNTGQGGGTVDADVDTSEAWDTTTGSDQTVVAILDCGTQTNHPDLSANLFANSGEIPGNSIDDDNNGYVDDVNGWDFYTNWNPSLGKYGDNDPNPVTVYDNHGTAVTGVAVARGNNSLGVAGVAFTSCFLPLRVMQTIDAYGNGDAYYDGIAEAIYYAAGYGRPHTRTWRGADILSMSIGIPWNQMVDDALTTAAVRGRNGKGCPIFVATGNFASGWRQYSLSGYTAATYTFRWDYQKDGSLTAGDDAVWLDDVTFPGGTLEPFEGSFPPAGWTTGGGAGWIQYSLPDRVLGTGVKSARSGAIGNNQLSYLQTTRAVGAGVLTFWAWVSSQQARSVGSLQATWVYPLSPANNYRRTQTIVLAGNLGSQARVINYLDLHLLTTSTRVLDSLMIRMKHTTLSAFSSATWDNIGWTTVTTLTNVSLATLGGVRFNLSTPFSYNGTNNLMIDITFSNTSTGTGGNCAWWNPGTYRTVVGQSNTVGNPARWTGTQGTPGRSTYVPWFTIGPGDVFRFSDSGIVYFESSGVPAVTNGISYPSSHPMVIAVGASTNFDYRSDYSQYGPGLKFLAPSSGGTLDIYTTDRTGTAGYNTSTSPRGDYDTSFSGTSSATPLAAGIAALILSKNDDRTSLDVLNIMRGTCNKISSATVTYDVTGWNQYYGYGRLNACSALYYTGAHGSTAADLASFDARQFGGAVLLDWRTGYEVNNLGFHVYREDGGRMTRLTEQMVAGSAFLAGAGTNLTAGASYSWWDVAARGSGPVRYWLEDIDLSGKRTRHGPVTPVVSARPLPLKSRAALLAQLGRVAGGTAQRIQSLETKLRNKPVAAQSGSTKPLPLVKSRLAKSVGRIAAAPSQAEVQWWLAGQPAVKLNVRKEGWYQVGQPELVAAGLDPSINPRFLQLYADGEEQPLFMADSARRLEPSDTIEFYGTGQDTPWTDARTYWLVAGPRRGQRIPVIQARSNRASGPQGFLFTVERKDRTVYFPALKNGEADNFFGPIITTQGADQLLTAPHLAPSPPSDATLEIALQGGTAGPHRVLVLFNNVEVGTIVFSGQEHPVATVSIPQAALLEGDNLVRLVAQGGETDISVVDCVRLTYWHSYTADNDLLRCTVPGGQTVTIDGFSSAAIVVVDITRPTAPRKLVGSVQPRGTSYAVAVRAPAGGQRTLLILTEDAIGSPAAIKANRPSTWHAAGQGADVAILSNGAFLNSLGPLKSLRESQGRSVALIDVEDLYDEFNFGGKSPWALRDFLARTRTQWQMAPRFVLLVGDAGVDPRNYLGLGEADFVPTKLVETTMLETASDDWFADLNGDDLPEIAVGRLPVRTAAEAAAAVAKIVAYEQAAPGDWATKVLLVADNNDVFDFEGASAAVAGLLPSSLTVDGVFLGWTNVTLARSMLMQKLNAGRLLVNYIGHGSVDTWASEELLTNADAAALTNSPRLPFVISMTCLNGFLHDPYTDSLAEALLKAERGGAIAVWASSGLTEPFGQAAMDKELIRLLFGGQSPTIGEATARAKTAVSDQDIRRTWILFGDPAMRLK
jgi:subtilisin family serine protease